MVNAFKTLPVDFNINMFLANTFTHCTHSTQKHSHPSSTKSMKSCVPLYHPIPCLFLFVVVICVCMPHDSSIGVNSISCPNNVCQLPFFDQVVCVFWNDQPSISFWWPCFHLKPSSTTILSIDGICDSFSYSKRNNTSYFEWPVSFTF